MRSALRNIAHARTTLKEQSRQPFFSQRIVPRKVMVQPCEADLGMPVAGYVGLNVTVAPEGTCRAEVFRR